MVRRCLLFLVVASLAVSAGPTWAAAVFVDVSATNGYTQAHPTGIAANGATVLQGPLPTYPSYLYHTYLYAGGTAATMTDITSLFGTNVVRIGSTNMNASGQFTACRTSQIPNNGWLDSGGTVTSFTYPGSYSTYSVGINNNGDISGFYRASSTDMTMRPYIHTGGVSYALNDNTTYGSCISSLNSSGQAVGWTIGGGVVPMPAEAKVWTYTISGGSVTAQTAVNIQTFGLTGPSLSGAAAAYPSALSSAAVAINSTGTVVVAANNTAQFAGGALMYNTANFLYDMTTQTYTSLGSLMLYDDQTKDGTGTYFGGHGQAINDSNQVVGRMDIGGGVYHAAVWENGTVTDLNTRYASILPSGFVLQNATAINNSGEIAGWGTDSLGNTYQAFEIFNKSSIPGDANLDGKVDINDLSKVLTNYDKTGMTWAQGDFNGDGKVDINDLSKVLTNYDKTAGAAAASFSAVPEPSTLLLTVGGLMGVLAYGWRKRK